MSIKIKLISLIVGVIIFMFIIKFIRKNSLRPSYSFLWVCVSLFLMSIPIFESFYKWISISVIGMLDSRNIIYIGLIIFLLIYTFYLTIKISKMSDQIQELISFTAILENEIKKNRTKKNGK